MVGASVDVSNVWAQWLRAHRDQLHQIRTLASCAENGYANVVTSSPAHAAASASALTWAS